ncbi:hypothetical protein QE364_001683 [Nocardioides zeae]|uniref:Uncharacterized protein n=1 Tax=Nocardioides zeae TaxID=1457234 RepID=A0ACC6IGT6_9ACTN|nr:hypothetical protein [Nocardioides zeae]MDR6172982.1 hypothetical protein [Nocardioides zeae]MDR6209976.1 hypothetical protein [Nocardioides zeae]
MRPSTAALLSLPVALLALAGCASEPDVSEVRIVSTPWNGWDPDHDPTATTWTLLPAEGEEADVGCGVTLTVVDVGGDHAVLRSSEDLAPTNDTGGIRLRDTQDEWEVERGEVVEAATATTDGGCRFELSVG